MRMFRLALWMVLGALILVPAPLQASPYTFTFNNLDPALIALSFSNEVGAPFEITNETGLTWTDFHFAVGIGPAGTEGRATLGGYVGPGTATLSATPENPFPEELPDLMEVVGLNIETGGVYSFSIDLAAGESGWMIAGYPTVDAVPPDVVPEPTSLILLGTGLVGLGRAWRKRRE